MTNANKPLALTLGDPAGIGPDISLFAFAARRHEHIPPFVLLGDPEVLRERARALDLATPIEVIDDAGAAPALFAEALPVLPIRRRRAGRRRSPRSGRGAGDPAFDRACRCPRR